MYRELATALTHEISYSTMLMYRQGVKEHEFVILALQSSTCSTQQVLVHMWNHLCQWMFWKSFLQRRRNGCHFVLNWHRVQKKMPLPWNSIQIYNQINETFNKILFDPRKLVYALPPDGKGKNETITISEIQSAAARHAHKVIGNMTHPSNSVSRSSCRWRSRIVSSVGTAHTIWAWKAVYRIIRSLELNSLGITMRPHAQQLTLETFPSGKERGFFFFISKNKYLY